MHHPTHTVDMIERALRITPYCAACGGSTDVVTTDQGLVLRCRAVDRPQGRLGRWLGSLIEPDHISIPLVEVDLATAA